MMWGQGTAPILSLVQSMPGGLYGQGGIGPTFNPGAVLASSPAGVAGPGFGQYAMAALQNPQIQQLLSGMFGGGGGEQQGMQPGTIQMPPTAQTQYALPQLTALRSLFG